MVGLRIYFDRINKNGYEKLAMSIVTAIVTILYAGFARGLFALQQQQQYPGGKTLL